MGRTAVVTVACMHAGATHLAAAILGSVDGHSLEARWPPGLSAGAAAARPSVVGQVASDVQTTCVPSEVTVRDFQFKMS